MILIAKKHKRLWFIFIFFLFWNIFDVHIAVIQIFIDFFEFGHIAQHNGNLCCSMCFVRLCWHAYIVMFWGFHAQRKAHFCKLNNHIVIHTCIQNMFYVYSFDLWVNLLINIAIQAKQNPISSIFTHVPVPQQLSFWNFEYITTILTLDGLRDFIRGATYRYWLCFFFISRSEKGVRTLKCTEETDKNSLPKRGGGCNPINPLNQPMISWPVRV